MENNENNNELFINNSDKQSDDSEKSESLPELIPNDDYASEDDLENSESLPELIPNDDYDNEDDLENSESLPELIPINDNNLESQLYDEYNLTNIYDNLIEIRSSLINRLEDEYNIIKELKIYLMLNVNGFNINFILQNVYNMLGIDIDISVFENIFINMSELNIFNEITYLPELENVVCILDDEVKLDSYTLTEEINSNCNICLENYVIEDEIIKLPCDHIYHKDCINNWLTNYSYICPCCKKEVGKSKYII